MDINNFRIDGWQHIPVGTYPSSGQLKTYDKDFILLHRKRKIEDFLKKSSEKDFRKSVKQRLSSAGSNAPIGLQKKDLTPHVAQQAEVQAKHNDTEQKIELTHFSEYPSLIATRRKRDSLLIGFDSEWVSPVEGVARTVDDMLSWQFAVVKDDELWEFVFIKIGKKSLSLDLALGRILDEIGFIAIDIRRIHRYEACNKYVDGNPVTCVYDSWQEAYQNSLYIYRDGRFTNELISNQPDRFCKRSERDWAYFHSYVDYSAMDYSSVTIVCHTGKVDLSSLGTSSSFDRDILQYCSDVQGGSITLRPIRIAPKSVDASHGRNVFLHPVSLSIADTMCHVPAKQKTLQSLGEVLGIHKIKLPEKPTKYIEHMDMLLRDNICLFLEYASTDSVVTLMYASALYGFNQEIPVTITSASASVMKKSIMEYLNCENDVDYNRIYRGLCSVNHGICELIDRPGYIENSSLEPISDKSHSIQFYASQAFHGGYNSCSEVGYYRRLTFDYDLRNAYPTAMCVVPDIDWDEPIYNEIICRELTLQDWYVDGILNPLLPFVAYVQFEFSPNVKYPCIPINVDGIPIFPRTSEGLKGVYACGPELYLAVCLGATVYCERGYIMNRLMKDDQTESYSLRSSVKRLVEDRNRAKQTHGKGSLEELILKTMVNSGFGKIAQNVIQKNTWSAYKDMMESLGCSQITNPVSACLITSIVRAVLLAAENQAGEQGYMTYSVTTDGFISDMPLRILKKLDLFGFRQCMEKSRLFLTDGADAELWEIKHSQSDLLNFTTRGNVSLVVSNDAKGIVGGVCAHNGAKSPFETDSYEDRLWLMDAVLSRTGAVACEDKEWTSFKELARGKELTIKTVLRQIHMDFDMKRKPVRKSFESIKPEIEGKTYEIANFTTEPFDTVDEYRKYRQKKSNITVLRTLHDWNLFWWKIDTDAYSIKGKDIEWAKLMSCIMGYRAGMWDIPAISAMQMKSRKVIDELRNRKKVSDEISERKTMVSDICRWVNRHNHSNRQFKPDNWKNARRPERLSSLLPMSIIGDLLIEMQSDYIQE